MATVIRPLKSRALPWVLFVLTLVAALVFFLWWRSATIDARRASEVERTARLFLVALTNFRAETIDEDVREIKSFAVGAFADQVETFFGPQATAAITSAKATSVGEVQSVFVQSLSGDTASVFGVVNEAVTNSSSPNPRTEVLRIDIQMIRTASGWKVDRVDLLQSPGGIGGTG